MYINVYLIMYMYKVMLIINIIIPRKIEESLNENNRWGFVRVGFCQCGVLSVWGFVLWGFVLDSKII